MRSSNISRGIRAVVFSTLYPGTAVEGIGRIKGFGGLEVNGDDVFPGLVGNFYVLGGKVDGRGELPEGVGDVLARLVGHVLSE
jgi:hypothetical protein